MVAWKLRTETMSKRGDSGLIQAGEIPAMKSLAKKFAPPTRAQQELLD